MNQILQQIDLTHFDYSWVAKFLSLFVLPSADEDFAILVGGYFVVNKVMPIGLVILTIYAGMVVSDLALYAIGAGARRIPWLNRLAVNERVRNFGDALTRNLFELVALCRVVPGLDMVAFIACGWSRVPLKKFLAGSILVSALYLPLMLYLVVTFGGALTEHVGLWSWPVLVAAVAIIGFARYRIFTLREGNSALKQPAPRFRVFQPTYRPVPEWRPRLRKLPAVSRARPFTLR